MVRKNSSSISITKCGHGALITAANCADIETLSWAINSLKKFNSFLNIQVERFYMECYGYPILTALCQATNGTVDGVKQILDNGFPIQLLTHESQFCGEFCNPLDLAINAKNYDVVQFLLSDEKRRNLFLETKKRQKYLKCIELLFRYH